MQLTLSRFQAILWTPWTITTIVIGLRVFVRAKLRNHGLEDYVMVLSWLCYLVTVSCIEAMTRPSETVYKVCVDMAGRFAGILTLLVAKIAATITLLRMTGATSQWRMWFLYANTSILTLLAIVVLAMTIAEPCKGPTQTAEWICLDYDWRIPRGFTYAWSIHGAIIDITYSLLAMSIVYKLKLRSEKKLGLYIVLGLGWIASPFSILRTTTGDEGLFYLGTSLEIALVIMSASIPTLMPLYQHWRHGMPLRPRASATGKDSALLQASRVRAQHSRFGASTAEEAITGQADAELAIKLVESVKQASRYSLVQPRNY